MPSIRSNKSSYSHALRQSPWHSISGHSSPFTSPSSTCTSLYSPPPYLSILELQNDNKKYGILSLLMELSNAGGWDTRTIDEFVTQTQGCINMEMKRLHLPCIPPEVSFNLDALPESLQAEAPNYIILIILAIWGSRAKCLTLSQICDVIDKRFPGLKTMRPAYQRSIRHRLSLEPIFVNVKKSSTQGQEIKRLRVSEQDENDDEGRGGLWIVDFSRRAWKKRKGPKGKKIQQNPSPALSSTGEYYDLSGCLAARAMYGYNPEHSELFEEEYPLHHDMPAALVYDSLFS